MILVTGEVRAALARIRHLCYEKKAFGRALQIDCVLLENSKPTEQAAFKRSFEDAKDYLAARSHVTNEDIAILSTVSILHGLNGYEQTLFSVLKKEVTEYLKD